MHELVVAMHLGADEAGRERMLVDDWLRADGLQAEGVVGHATARLTRSRAIVATVLPRLGRDPLEFLHPAEAGCAECDVARVSLGRDARRPPT